MKFCFHLTSTFLIALISCLIVAAQDASLSNEIGDEHVEKYTIQPLFTTTTGSLFDNTAFNPPTTSGSSTSNVAGSTFEASTSTGSSEQPSLPYSESSSVSTDPSSSSSIASSEPSSSTSESFSPTTIVTSFNQTTSILTTTAKPTSIKYPRPLVGPNGLFRVMPVPSAPISPHAIAGIPFTHTRASPSTTITRQGKCTCYAETTTIIRYYRAFDEELQLGDQSIVNCQNPIQATNQCEALCKAKAQNELNQEFDLRLPFTANADKRVGQALCSQLGSVLVPTHMRIKSHTVCFGQGWSVSRDTGMKSKGRFLCVLGRFQTVP